MTTGAALVVPCAKCGQLHTDPIPMRLLCERCGELHIDVDEFATKLHHTHSCQHCGLTWRPAVICTVGVQFLPGFRNANPPPAMPKFAPSNGQTAIALPSDDNEKLLEPIDTWDVSSRVISRLEGMDVRLTGELVVLRGKDLLKARNFGKGSLRELERALATKQLSLGTRLAPEVRELIKQRRRAMERRP